MSRVLLAVAALALLLATACSGASGTARVNAAPRREAVPRTIVTPGGAESIDALLERARWNRDQGRCRAAIKLYRRVVLAEPSGTLAPEARFGEGQCHLELGELRGAEAAFEEVVRAHPKHGLAPRALGRLVRLLAYREAFDRAARWARTAIDWKERLSPTELVVARAAVALEILSQEPAEAGDDRRAEHAARAELLRRAEFAIEQGRSVLEDHRLDSAGSFPPELALLYYALGELRRQRAAAIRFNPFPASFGEALERRCQLILDAQAAYSESMRAKDPHWAAMAGYRTAQLYERLHGDLMAVPPPDTTPLKRQLFEGALRLRYTLLLDKAKIMLTHTLAMAERTGLKTGAARTARGSRRGARRDWLHQSREALDRVKRAQASEKAAIDALPLTRAQLQKELDTLGSGS